MTLRFFLTAWLACAAITPGAFVRPLAAASSKDAAVWERSMVTIELTRKQYDHLQPWSKRTETYQKGAVVVAPRQLLTTADQMADHTLIRVQKGGRGHWTQAKVSWVDYHANLALIEVEDAKFWSGLTPVVLADPVPTRGEASVVRWREGQLETRLAEVNRIHIHKAKLSVVEHVHMEVDCEIKGAGWAEAVVSGRKLIGITVAQDGNTCTVMPAPFIRRVIEAQRKGTYRGLGYFDFVWQRSENPATHGFLKQKGEPRGVVVVVVPKPASGTPVLKPKDILLKIDGFNIDIQGDFVDPVYGNLMLEGLATRGHWAGDKIPIRILRDGVELDVEYVLPKADYDKALVPIAVYDREPEYVVAGGLVFQTLNEPYLRSWGGDWRRRVPFRLGYYTQDEATPERPSVVILSLVLPDPFNLGYHDHRYLAVHKVNGRAIRYLGDIAEALKSPTDGFHVIDFDVSDSMRRLVLDASQLEAATRRVMQRYGIDSPALVHPKRS